MEEKITSEVKTKDPRRVEAGKKLAAISKAAKEKKMRERLSLEAASTGSGISYYTFYLIPTISVLIAACSLYFSYYRGSSSSNKEKVEKEPEYENKNNVVLTPKRDTLDKL